ncbi:MAG: hypothetical protein DSY60_00195 [Persephonella sp.]|nr:MAG: hypothetical protein DSY60_00195 [Persephonella sp.]
MIKKISILLFFIIFNITFATTPLFDKFEKKLRKYETFKADIKEELYIKDFDDKDIYFGKLTINKRGEVLFIFTKPEKMFIYVDTKGYIYAYSYEDKEGYRKKASSSEFYLQLFRRFLTNKEIKDLFKSIREYTKGKSNDYVFVLIPKDKEIKKVIMETDKNFNIKFVEIYTNDGKVLYRFSNIQYLKKLEPIPNDIKKLIKKIK